jgi:hypothetical protein
LNRGKGHLFPKELLRLPHRLKKIKPPGGEVFQGVKGLFYPHYL